MKSIDALKGVAIIAVILYHLGFVRTGYLGVDIFLVINGFLIIPSACKKLEEGSFSSKDFLLRRFMRLTPLLLLGCLVSMVTGYIGMLPDDYENLSQSVVAGVFFSNNILASITTRDYWNIVNEYKPLMHTWYLGILMEFYVIFVCIIVFSRLVSKVIKKISVKKLVQILLVVLAILSLALYFVPSFSEGVKFYWIFFRFFEIVAGGLVGLCFEKIQKNKLLGNQKFSFCAMIFLVLLVFSSVLCGKGFGTQVIPIGAQAAAQEASFLPGEWLLLLTVLLSCFSLCTNHPLFCNNILTAIGKRSYSLFIWHQIVLAFYRYFISKNVTIITFCIYVMVVAVLSELTYVYIEQMKAGMKSVVITIAMAGVIVAASSAVYVHAGVVRDVPELGISKNNVHRGMHAEYVDRIYVYDKDFDETNGKINVLVVGNSFARDWSNILLESKMADKINLSYSFDYNSSENFLQRIESSDYIFSFSSKEGVPQYVWNHIQKDTEVWGIGTKNFGECNGIIYAKRFQKGYYEQYVEMIEGYEKLNEQWKESWGDHYIDLIAYVRNENGQVRVFSPEHQLISQDCEHLTQGGAQYYADIIDFSAIFNILL